tara:strand:+ start:611 stop:868 length:258 start_codon:yes stop_codon:yes gene_type:complete
MSFSKRAFEELNKKGKSMKEIDIDVANKLAKKVVSRIKDDDAKTMKIMAITFATKLFVSDPKAYEDYFNLDGELDLIKLVGDKDE